MVQIDERLKHEILHGEFLAKDAARYWGHGSLAGQRRVTRRVELFVERASMKPGVRVCEIGCGTGIFTKHLLERSGADIVAIDLSPDLLEIARRDVSDTRVNFLLGDCMDPESWGVPLDFDAVVTNSVLHHLDVPKSLAAIFRMLKPGGVFVCSEPNMMNPQIAIQKNIPFIKKWMGDSPDETAFFRWRIIRDLAKAGFVDARAVPFDFLHPKIPAVLANGFDGALRFFEKIPLIKEIAGSLIVSARKP